MRALLIAGLATVPFFAAACESSPERTTDQTSSAEVPKVVVLEVDGMT